MSHERLVTIANRVRHKTPLRNPTCLFQQVLMQHVMLWCTLIWSSTISHSTASQCQPKWQGTTPSFHTENFQSKIFAHGLGLPKHVIFGSQVSILRKFNSWVKQKQLSWMGNWVHKDMHSQFHQLHIQKASTCQRGNMSFEGHSLHPRVCMRLQDQKMFTLLDLCVSSLRRGHADLL